jgi:hypothetical protein
VADNRITTDISATVKHKDFRTEEQVYGMGEKTHSVQFYVTEDVKQTLRIAAAENQESMAAFARTALQEALEDHEVQSDD